MRLLNFKQDKLNQLTKLLQVENFPISNGIEFNDADTNKEAILEIQANYFLNTNSEKVKQTPPFEWHPYLELSNIDNPNIITTINTNSFTDVRTDPTSQITFYLTNNITDLSPTWQTIATYYSLRVTSPNPSCFNEGTKILCLNNLGEEEYIPIENLRKGNLVKTYNRGYRKIDLIGKQIMKNDPDRCRPCMYKLKKTEENGLTEDLFITGGHSILVDDLKEFLEVSLK